MDTGIDRSVWTDGDFPQRLMEADEKHRTAPHTLTDKDIACLDAYHGNARQARQKRETALTERATAAPPRIAAPPARRRYWTTPEFDAWTKAVLRFLGADVDMAGDEQAFDEYEAPITAALEAHFGTPQAAHEMKGLLFPVLVFLQLVVKKNREKREDLHDRVRRLESLIVLADNQIKNLETNTTTRGLSWAGEFDPGATYTKGAFVGYRGGVWTALRDCVTAPGTHLGDWDVIIPPRAKP